METNTFKMLLFKFCEIVNDRPLLFTFDGHLTQYQPLLSRKDWSKIYSYLSFPPHITDVLQLLDVACFGPLKREWERRVHKCIFEYDIKQPPTKSDFVNELRAIWNTGMKRDNVISGFEATGTVLKIFKVIYVYYISIKS